MDTIYDADHAPYRRRNADIDAAAAFARKWTQENGYTFADGFWVKVDGSAGEYALNFRCHNHAVLKKDRKAHFFKLRGVPDQPD